MAYVDSSVGSPLASLRNGVAAPELDIDDLDDEEAVVEDVRPEPREGDLKAALIEQIGDINLARSLPTDVLDTIGQVVIREYRLDETSRDEWKQRAETAMRFAMQEGQPKVFPWEGASNVIFPLITQAAVQFAAVAYPAIVQNRSVVKGVVWGDDKGTPVTEDGTPNGPPKVGPDGQPVWLVKPGEKRERADRIGEFMSWQLLEEMPEWEPQVDQLLHQIPIVGGAAKKTYRDPVEDRNCSPFVSLIDLVWAYSAPSFEAAPRHSERLLLYPHEIVEMEQAGDDGEGGAFLHLDYGPGTSPDDETLGFDENRRPDPSDTDAPHLFIEQHRRYDLDGDGYAEPYVITVHERSGKVVRIVARYDEDGIEATEDGSEIRRIVPVEHYTLIPFLPSIDGGSYPVGFGHLLRPLNEAINTTLNQMFDAGTLQNAGGGFISDQLGAPSGPIRFQVGKYVRVTTKGRSIRESVFPMPFQGPSAVLFQLLGVLLEGGKQVASIQDVLAGGAEMANAPPTTVLALIEQGLKVYTAIHKRVYRALKSEFGKLYRLNRLYLQENRKYRVGEEWREVTPDDFRLGGGVEPIADPTMTTDMQRLGRAQIVATFKDDPLVNQLEIRRRLLEAANIDRIDELLITQPNPQAMQMAQVALQMKVAELGRERAAEMKDTTQAYLNLALARKNASGPEEGVLDRQLEVLRLQIEAINTSVKAAAVDHRFHDSNMRMAQAHADRLAKFPEAPGPVPGNGTGGVPAMAPSPGDGGLPGLPQGPGGQFPGGGNGPLAGGPPLGQ